MRQNKQVYSFFHHHSEKNTMRQILNHGCRISDEWSYRGMRALIIENELLRVTVLVDKGSDIVEFRYKLRDIDFLLMRPEGIRNPARDVPSAHNNQVFLDYFSGGWNEILPNGGGGAVHRGAEYGQHGEISLIPWGCAITEDTPERVSARLWVRAVRTPFYLEKTMTLESGRAVLTIHETLTNEGGEPLDFMWGQHIAFGRPFLDEGAVIDVPASKLIVGEMSNFGPRRFQPGITAEWSRVPAPDGTMLDATLVPPYGEIEVQDIAYLTELSDGWYAITNPERKVGFGTHFDHDFYRYIWYWQSMGGAGKGYPWWGRLHTMALEPWTSYPTHGLPSAVANGTARVLQPGEQIRTTFRAVAYEGLERVSGIAPDGTVTGSVG
jgi:hypothetical protein